MIDAVVVISFTENDRTGTPVPMTKVVRLEFQTMEEVDDWLIRTEDLVVCRRDCSCNVCL